MRQRLRLSSECSANAHVCACFCAPCGFHMLHSLSVVSSPLGEKIKHVVMVIHNRYKYAKGFTGDRISDYTKGGEDLDSLI